MKYNQPFGISDPNAAYINGNPSTGTMGSIPPAASIEFPQREVVKAISASGFTPDNADLAQLAQAIRSQRMNYFLDTGSSDIVSVSTGGVLPLAAYTPGLTVRVKKVNAANTSTGPTISIDGLVPKVITTIDGGLIEVGALKAHGMLELTYDPVADVFVFMNGIGTSPGPGPSPPDQTIMEAAAFPHQQIFMTPGTFTFTVPTGCTKVRARVWGGGGGGGTGLGNYAGASGGGGGGYSQKICTVTPGQVISVTVGAGAAASAGGDGFNGGTSSFGAFCSATGGIGGQHPVVWYAPGLAIGTGGSGSGGDINMSGSYGGTGLGSPGTDIDKCGGGGGQAPLGGGGGYQSTGTSGPGLWPGGGGSGGGGSSALNSPGGNGGNGGVIVEWVSIP